MNVLLYDLPWQKEKREEKWRDEEFGVCKRLIKLIDQGKEFNEQLKLIFSKKKGIRRKVFG